MHTIYHPNLKGGAIIIKGSEAHHTNRVLRLDSGNKVGLTDGKGKYATGNILSTDKDETRVWIDANTIQEGEPQPRFSVALAPTKQSNRIEFAVEKCTEMGLRTVYPLITFNSERRQLRIDRLERIALSAMKQSKRTWLPEIKPIQKLGDFLESAPQEKRCIAHCHENLDRDSLNQVIDNSTEPMLIVIGPEGDFSSGEVDLAQKHGFVPVGFGHMRLRTETAALFACAAFTSRQ